MVLDELIGLHELSGVDFGQTEDNANYMLFVLDVTTYIAIEDPSDGYRSMMSEISVSDKAVGNRFAPQRVLCYMRGEVHYHGSDVLDCRDVITGKLVLSVGTDDYDDYYPTFVCEFTPEHMAINQRKEE